MTGVQTCALPIYELPVGRGKRFANNANGIVNGFLGNWSVNVQSVVQRGFILDFPNAAPLAARTANLTDSQRDEAAKQKNRSQFDVSTDKWYDVTLFPNKAQAPFTLRDFPTRFPDVRTRGLKSFEISIYKEIVIKERVRWQIRGDFQNAMNYPLFGKQQSNNVTDSRFGQLQANITNEPRLFVAVMKVIF